MKNFSFLNLPFQFWLLLPISIFCLIGSVFFFSQIFSPRVSAVEGEENISVQSTEGIDLQSAKLQESMFAPFSAGTSDTPNCWDGGIWKESWELNRGNNWSLPDIPYTNGNSSSSRHANAINQFMDINGDGLPDYIFSHNILLQSYGKNLNTNNWQYYTSYHRNECVMLNSGKGWEVEYRCMADSRFNTSTGTFDLFYRGDCAK